MNRAGLRQTWPVGATGGLDLRRNHVPALDGIRAFAIAAVLAYHLGVGWAGGGFIGVDVFFVLSGFLITSLLVNERSTSGAIRLGAFWGRRARRLLPALLLVLGAVALYTTLGGSGINPQVVRGDALSALLYVANWHFIATNNAYFSHFALPSPLEHTWSLAIEEQFYVVWPVLLLGFSRLGGRRSRSFTMTATAILAAASVADMAWLAHRAPDVSRAYFGTDTRAFELMIGALLAMCLPNWQKASARAVRFIRDAGIGSACLLVVGCAVLGGPPRWMFDGGFVAVAILTAVLIASVCLSNRGFVARFLCWKPVRWVGTVSYGLYLWHWPVFVVLTQQSTGWPGWTVDMVRVALTVGIATVSFYVVEQPIRRMHRLPLRGLLGISAAFGGAISVVLVLATIPTATAGADEPPPVQPPTDPAATIAKVPTHADPLRVLLIGDSVMMYTSTGLSYALKSTGEAQVDSIAFPGWGLTTDPYWKNRLRVAISQFKPDVVVGTWAWDWVTVGSRPAYYRNLLDQALADDILAPGNGVQGLVFLQFPQSTKSYNTKSPATGGRRVYLNASITTWNAIAASEATRHPRSVSYLPVATALERDNQVTSWLPDAQGRWTRVRSTDGVHFCPAGTARYTEAVMAYVQGPWHLATPRPGWWRGPWIRAGLYRSPPGQCPSDQPPNA